MNSIILTGLMSIGCGPVDADYIRMAYSEPRVLDSCKRGVTAVFVTSGVDLMVRQEEEELERTGRDLIMETFNIKTLDVITAIFIVSRVALGGEVAFEIAKNTTLITKRDGAEINFRFNF